MHLPSYWHQGIICSDGQMQLAMQGFEQAEIPWKEKGEGRGRMGKEMLGEIKQGCGNPLMVDVRRGDSLLLWNEYSVLLKNPDWDPEVIFYNQVEGLK